MTGSITPIRQTRSYPLFWRWHFLAAIIVIPFVLWQSTTGTLYLWSEWWMDVQHPSLRFVAEASSPMPPSQQLAAALAAVKDAPQSAAPQGHQAHASHGEALQSSDSPRVVQLVLPDDPRRSQGQKSDVCSNIDESVTGPQKSLNDAPCAGFEAFWSGIHK